MKSVLSSAKLSILLLLPLVFLSLKCSSNGSNATNSNTHRVNVADFLSEKQFNDMFPQRDKFYTYAAFIKAIKELDKVSVKVVRRSVSVYQFTRTDKSTGQSTVIRQDEDWNEDWAKKKPDSTYVIDYGNFCSEKDLQTDKKELAAFFANIAHEPAARFGNQGASVARKHARTRSGPGMRAGPQPRGPQAAGLSR